MENQETDVLTGIIFVSIVLVVFLLALVIIISALNTANSGLGKTLTSGLQSETLYAISSTPQTLSTSTIITPSCNIVSVTNLSGSTIPSTNYTINNCLVTFR